MSKPETVLFLSDARGIYIPRDFAQSIKRECLSGVSAETLATLESGPDSEWYWEAWDELMQSAIVTDSNGVQFTVYQDGDCWLIPKGMEWSEESGFFVWPSDESDDSESAEG